MTEKLIGLWKMLAFRRRIQFSALIVGMVVAGIFEMLSLAVFAQLIAALAAPGRTAEANVLFKINAMMKPFGWEEPDSATLGLVYHASLFAALAFLAGSMRILIVWANAKFTAVVGTDISSAVYESCLNLSYADHLGRGSGELLSLVRDKARQTGSVVFFLLNLGASALIAAMICAGLAILHPWLTLATMSLLGGFYLLIAWGCREKLFVTSRIAAKESTQAVKAVQEGLGSIRDVILNRSQTFYKELFRRAEGMVQKAGAVGIFIGAAPRYFTDTFAMVVFSAILVIWLKESSERSNAAALLPALGVLGLGAQRIMPLLQQIYSSWAVISANSDAVKMVLENLKQRELHEEKNNEQNIKFDKNIKLKDVSFKYKKNLQWVIYKKNFNILKGSCVGINGKTGCGKSTLIDIIMGLLKPSEGVLEIDGIALTKKNIRAWQKKVAHVPQSIFLTDMSVLENIAFGVNQADIDIKKVKSAAETACLADFIQSNPKGYGLVVGEKGVRLSGGQRQRIGIARALYREPELLILDEATNALDSKTEKKLVNNLLRFRKNTTILIISHNYKVLSLCDKIIQLKK